MACLMVPALSCAGTSTLHMLCHLNSPYALSICSVAVARSRALPTPEPNS